MASQVLDTKVAKQVTKNDQEVDVMYKSTLDGSIQELCANNLFLATGGFSSNWSKGLYLDQNQPELMSFLEIAGNVSIGDSITLAMALAAGTRDMDMIQVHSMGWVNPPSTGPSKNPTKVGKKV